MPPHKTKPKSPPCCCRHNNVGASTINECKCNLQPTASLLQTLREAQCINKSLSFLEQTVTALAKKEAHIPFRQSRLTSVLRDALGGNCKVGVRACVCVFVCVCLCVCACVCK